MSHNTIYAMHKDARGFLWFGTGYGLNRYNGKEFEWFLQENKGLASNFVHHIFEDDGGMLWLFTLEDEYELNWFEVRELCLLDIYTGEVFTVEQKFPEGLPFDIADLHFMKMLPDGSMIFITEEGNCFKYHSKKGFYPFKLQFDFYKILDLISITDNSFWILLNKQWQPPKELLIKTNLEGEVLHQIEEFPSDDSYFVGKDDSDNLWFGLEIDNGYSPEVPLYYLSPNDLLIKEELTTTPLPWNQIGLPLRFRTLQLEEKRNYFWGKANNEIFVFDLNEGLVFDFRNEQLSSDERLDMNILFDHKTTWMTDGKSGLSAIELKPNYFKTFLSTRPVEPPNVYSCRGIVTDNYDRIWVGTYNLAQVVEQLDGSHRHIPGVDYTSMMKDRQGNIWTAHEDGLACFRGAEEQAEIFSKEGISTGDFWSIHEDAQGIIWYANGVLLYYFDPKTKTFYSTKLSDDFPEYEDAYVYSIKDRNDSSLWLATSTGLYVYHKENGIIAQFNLDQTDDYYIPAKDVHHLYEDKEGLMWLATGDGGLLKLIIDNEEAASENRTGGLEVKEVQQFTIANGLTSNSLHAVYEDDYGHLWLSSENGLNQFNKSNFQVENYFLEDGISDNEFNRISHYQDEAGKLYFGGVNGITVFDPKDFYEEKGQKYAGPLEIIAFQQFSSETDSLEDRTPDLMKNKQIELRPGDRFFNLTIALLDYEQNESVHYAYQIEGLNDNWTITRDNQINLSGLPYGEFDLRIKGHNGDGQYSENELRIPIVVLRPFYLQGWFLILTFIIGLVVIMLFLKWRTARLTRQKNQLEQMVLERTQIISQQAEQLRELDKVKSRFFANVSHELRTPLTLMLGPISTLLKSKKDESRSNQLLRLAQNNGRQLLRLINEILDLTKLESGKLELKERSVRLLPFLNRLQDNFESHAHQRGLDFHFDAPIDKEGTFLLDSEKFEKIVNNLLSNAIKFTPPGGVVLIKLEERTSNFLLEVRDSGRGIHEDDLPYVFDRFYQSKQPDVPTQGGTGIGLALCREYASLFGGWIWVESELGKGSQFFFEFPKKQAEESGTLYEETEVEAVSPLKENENIPLEKAPIVSSTGQAQLLIVEDNNDLRNYLSSILEGNYRILKAQNGQEGLDILEQNTDCQLIISDVMMPVMDGFVFLNRLKSLEHFRQIPVIMLTALAEKKDKLKALRIGVDDYLLKPFEEEELIVRIDNLLRNSLERRRFFETEIKETATRTTEVQEIEAKRFSEEDQFWLENLENQVLEAIGNFNFNTEVLSQSMNLSRRQLNRRIKKMTGLASAEYIRAVRFREARRLLEARKYSTVKAVAYRVGVKSLDYFSKQFKERFGKSPSEYL